MSNDACSGSAYIWRHDWPWVPASSREHTPESVVACKKCGMTTTLRMIIETRRVHA